MTTQKNKLARTVAVIAVILGLIAVGVMLLVYFRQEPARTLPEVTPRPTAQVVVKEREVEKLVEVEKEITGEIISEGLRELGFLVTEEYYFTEVVSFSSIKSIFKIELPFTASHYLASYDGVVTAGVDFTGIRAEKDDENRLIRVTMPPAQLRGVDIDTGSFTLYDEKSGVGNPISVADFNASLQELEATAEGKALERGILTRSEENARCVVKNFILGLAGSEYAVEFAG